MTNHHQPCPCGKELADECPDCAQRNPLGSMRIEAPIQDDVARAALCCCECSPPEFGGNLPDRECPTHGVQR